MDRTVWLCVAAPAATPDAPTAPGRKGRPLGHVRPSLNAGQVRVSSKRIILVDAIYDRFMKV